MLIAVRRVRHATRVRAPRRREAAELGHHLPVNRSAASKITKAPGMIRANANWKNGVKCVMRRESAPQSAATRGATEPLVHQAIDALQRKHQAKRHANFEQVFLAVRSVGKLG
jgi:hypothetical protein